MLHAEHVSGVERERSDHISFRAESVFLKIALRSFNTLSAACSAQNAPLVICRAVVKSTFVESKTSPSPKRFESESSPSPKRSESSPSPKRFESKSKSKSK